MKFLFGTYIILASGAALFGQAVQFEVASIRPAQPLSAQKTPRLGLRMDGSQARISSYALRDYVAMAYRTKAKRVLGPEWIETVFFDVNATIPSGYKAEQIPEMLQSLLTERFQMKLHREQRELPAYVLSLGKGPLQLTELPADATDISGARTVGVSGSENGVGVNLGNGSSYTFSNNRFEAKKLTLANLGNQLERFLDRPVVDQTGLKGSYDLVLNVTEEDYQTMLIRVAVGAGIVLPPQALQRLEGATFPSLFESFEKLGLKLEARKLPQDVIVVDQASKTPTEN